MNRIVGGYRHISCQCIAIRLVLNIIKSGTKDGELGLIDDTYYFRRSEQKSWVNFNDKLWRIISIDNGILRLFVQKQFLWKT